MVFVRIPKLPLIAMIVDLFCSIRHNLMLNKYQWDPNLQQYTQLWIVHIYIGVYECLTSSRG